MTASDPEERLGTITTEPVGRFMLFRVRGKSTTEFLTLLADRILGGTGPAALELVEIDLVNSSVVGFVMMLLRQLSQQGREFCVVAPSPKLVDVLTITHTIELVPVAADAAALATR